MRKYRNAMTLPLPILIATEELREFCKQNHVQELALFGSALTPNFSESSDIDLLVTFEPGARIGLLALTRMQRELEELLGRQVDLVPKGGLKSVIRASVLANARVLYAA
jgi:predicted nucleotidyltransferase